MSLIKPESETPSVAMDVSPIITSASDSAPVPDPTPTVEHVPSSVLDSLNLSDAASTSEPLSTTTSSMPASIPSTTDIQNSTPLPPSQDQSTNSSMNGANSSNSNNSTRLANGPATASALDRGPLGLTADEEQWVRGKMEYALYDFEVLSLAIKRYKWQLSQVPKDVNRLQNLKEKHMSDPFEFLRQLKNKEFRYPEGQRTLPAPTIEWTKYQFPPANPVTPTKTPRTTYLSSQQALNNLSQPGLGLSSSPGMSTKGHDMEGIIYSGQSIQTTGSRSESTPATQLGASYFSTQQLQVPNDQPASEPVNLTIDHSLGYNPIQPSDFGNNSNITYNHMSGSVDVQPGNVAKPRGSSREGSGVRDDPKPPLYNIPWSDEEQQLLERLLEVFPDEPVAAQRFQKISAAMGTRTPKQVASRVQKYFIKLVKAGLEAPGRMNYSLETSKSKNKGVSAAAKGKKRKDGPGGGAESATSGKAKAARPPKKKELSVEANAGSGLSGPTAGGTKKKQKAKSLLGSGFGRTSGTQYLHYSSAPTVYMSDEDDEESVQDMLGVSSSNVNNSSSVHGISSQRGSPDGGVASHIGYSCDSCGVEPILGIRYSCMDCEELGGTDLCGPCYNSGEYQNELHLLSHRFQAIETAEVPAYRHDYRSSSAGPSGTSGIYQTQ
ncbi:ZZ-type zinc finger-containing protein 3 [Entomortierella chlamydospora]|nr:ZZ-type zinc finger-containing protein 3 [Entomortierella chlamydospora]